VETGYPKCIRGNWPGLGEAFPEGVDTAIRWSATIAYFFKGNYYVRYDMTPQHEGVVAGYPRPIHGNWPGLDSL